MRMHIFDTQPQNQGDNILYSVGFAPRVDVAGADFSDWFVSQAWALTLTDLQPIRHEVYSQTERNMTQIPMPLNRIWLRLDVPSVAAFRRQRH